MGHASYVNRIIDRFLLTTMGGNSSLISIINGHSLTPRFKIDPWLVIRYYEIRLLDYLGFPPQLFECVNCGREILAEDQFYSFSAGGISAKLWIGLGLILGVFPLKPSKYLRISNLSVMRRRHGRDPVRKCRQRPRVLCKDILRILLERELNTPGFIKRVRS